MPSSRGVPKKSHDDDEDDDDDARFPQPDGDGEGGYSYGTDGTSGADVPLMSRHHEEDSGGEVVFDGDDELERKAEELPAGAKGDVMPYAHRDLKPG
jgi:serine/threonine kinase 16